MEANQRTLEELEILRDFKRRMPHVSLLGNVSPFDVRIATIQGGSTGADYPELHRVPREIIQQTIRGVRDGLKPSQVILISGDAGTGKTHLLNGFRSTELQESEGYIYAGGSNHWKMSEFQPRLLDWVVEALTTPSPTEKHALLERIETIGFRAVDHLLENPVAWRSVLVTRLGWLGRKVKFLERVGKLSRERLKRLADQRDPALFGHFDLVKFADYVCRRFLAEGSNPLHRYAMRVMLSYLFHDVRNTGINERERVLNWFRGKDDDGYFLRLLGTRDFPDKAYNQFEAVKLLSHLFSKDVSKQLDTAKHPCRPRVLLLTFDQAEGRNELFDSDSDWSDFFAQLSELYSTLPNVVVLFTMTNRLRDRLHGSLERQFRDRVRMDKAFELRVPTKDQLLGIYVKKMDEWLRDDQSLKSRFSRIGNRYTPFDADEIEREAGTLPVRESFEILDKLFHDRIGKIVVGALYDYKYFRNELQRDEDSARPFDFSADHAATVRLLLEHAKDKLSVRHGFAYKINPANIGNTDVLEIEFTRPGHSGRVFVTLARVSFRYKENVEQIVTSALKGGQKHMNFLFVVRPDRISEDVIPEAYRDQMFLDICSPAVEATCRGLAEIARRQLAGDYPNADQQSEFDTLLAGEMNKIYLGRMLSVASEKLAARLGKDDAAPP